MDENTTRVDGIMRFELLGGQARALLMDTTRMVEAARAAHGLSRLATAALGRLMTGTAALGAFLKGDGSVTATIKGDGPLGTVLAVSNADCQVKGYVQCPDVELPPREDGKLDVAGGVGHRGKLTVAKDLGLREPYAGIINLVSGEIAEDLAMYFTVSEQTPSMVALGVRVDSRVIAAGGLVAQVMPGCSQEAIAALEGLKPDFADVSRIIGEYGLEGVSERYLKPLDARLLGALRPEYRCDCSRERFARGLMSLGADELRDMLAADGGATVNCRFCEKQYVFTADELRELLAALEAPEGM